MKTEIRHLACLGLVTSLILALGCISQPRYYGGLFTHAGNLSDPDLYPLYPIMNYSFGSRYETINTLNPELKWSDKRKPNQTYDLCLWETSYNSVKDVDFSNGQSWGTPVYSVNNISENVHQVTLPLKPDTLYNWSVRLREGSTVGAWGAFRQDIMVCFAFHETHYNCPFGFKTPCSRIIP